MITILKLLDDNFFHQFEKYADNNSVLDIFQDLINENAFSRIIAYFLNSGESHGLGDYFLKQFLLIFKKDVKSCDSLESNTSSPWKTHENKFLDILVTVKDSQSKGASKTILALGIENKVFAKERDAQLSDYQKALIHSFPKSPKLLVFLNPLGKAPKTASDKLASNCLVRALSYKELLPVALHSQARCQNADAKMLLKAFPIYIEKHILECTNGGTVKSSIKTKISSSPRRQNALELIRKNIFLPNLRNLIYEYLVRELKTEYPSAYIAWHHPRATPYPREFNISLQGLYQDDFEVYYQLHSDDNSATFTIRLMAWCGKKDGSGQSPKYVEYAENMRKAVKSKLPKLEGTMKQWPCWRCIWAGPEYKIADSDITNVESEGLKKFVLDVIDNTYKPVVSYLHKHKI
ncbi:MAG: PD-(D/E)XK nuclease family protein [Elusimicrobia bacterium]|nr:PD-(D/E)XK nuclease family protein [Elusimicrobiota bacterium]